VGDTRDEIDESFLVNLSAPTGATLGDSQGAGTIRDNDPLPRIAISDRTLTEGNSGTKTFSFTVTLSSASDKTVRVNYATANGTALAGSDFTATSGTLTFNPGQTSQTVSVVLLGDTAVEPDEMFFVNLSGASEATIGDSQGRGLISNDDTTLRVSDATANEGHSGTTNFTFTITLSAAVSFPVTVTFRTGDLTAIAGSDYSAVASTPLTFNPGQTSKTFTVAVWGDTAVEANETFRGLLGSSTNAVISDGLGIGTIVNDDTAGLRARSAPAGNLPGGAPPAQRGLMPAVDAAIEQILAFDDAQAAAIDLMAPALPFGTRRSPRRRSGD
jgi:hypothetical protein